MQQGGPQAEEDGSWRRTGRYAEDIRRACSPQLRIRASPRHVHLKLLVVHPPAGTAFTVWPSRNFVSRIFLPCMQSP